MSRRIAATLSIVVVACRPTGGDETVTESVSTSGATADTTAGATTDAPAVPPLSCPKVPPTEETTDGTAELCPERPTTDACCCFEDLSADGTSSAGAHSVCGLEDLCPTINFVCMEDPASCPIDALATFDEAHITCALQALADGKVGRIAWNIDDQALGLAHEDIKLELVGDGTTFRHGSYHVDLCWEIYSVERLPLPAKTFFADCLAIPDWRTQFDCIRQALTCGPIETCIEGHGLSVTFLREPARDSLEAAPSPAHGC